MVPEDEERRRAEVEKGSTVSLNGSLRVRGVGHSEQSKARQGALCETERESEKNKKEKEKKDERGR